MALACQVPLAMAGDVEGVHQARVASRRVREFLPLLAVDEDRREEVRKLRSQARRLTRGLGPVRELDVALLRLEAMVAAGGPRAAAAERVRRALVDARPDACAALRDALESVPIDRFRRAVADAAAGTADPEARRLIAVRLGRRLDTRCLAVVDALDAAGIVYAPDRLHRVRVAMKKFRYALELAQDLGRVRLRGSIVRLKRLQDVLGALHDDEWLAARTRDVAATCRGGTRRAIDTFADVLDGEVRQRHAEFVREREVLPAVFRWTRRASAALKGQDA